jgi:hypothetical protein
MAENHEAIIVYGTTGRTYYDAVILALRGH